MRPVVQPVLHHSEEHRRGRHEEKRLLLTPSRRVPRDSQAGGEGRSHQPHHPAGGSGGDHSLVPVDDVGAEISDESGQEKHDEEARNAPFQFHPTPQDQHSQRIEGQVEETEVEKQRREETIGFAGIDKDYGKDLYEMQFALYIDNIVGRIDLQTEAYGKEENLPGQLFEIYKQQKADLLALKEKHGAIVNVEKL